MKNSNIEWTDHTFNPWEGCTKVSPGCLNCYAETRNQRFSGGKNWGNGAPRRRTSASNWKQPLKWNRDARRQADSWNTFRDSLGTSDEKMIENGHEPFRRPRVFCASLADWLDDEVPIEWLADLLKLIHDTPNLDWLLLTKRLENWYARIQSSRNYLTSRDAAVAIWLNDWLPTPATSGAYERGRQATTSHPSLPGEPPQNVWLGTSVEDQTRADERIPELLKIPARIRFLSCEPLLSHVDLQFSCFNGADSFGAMPGIHWVICGGESGKNKRPMGLGDAYDLRDQCKQARVAFFMKQIDKVQPIPDDLLIREFPTLSPGEMTASGGSVHPTHTVTLDRSPGE